MKKSTRVLVTGPLARYAAGYRAELDRHGYSPWTAVSYLYSFARLSRWLATQGLTAVDLDAECIATDLGRPSAEHLAAQIRDVIDPPELVTPAKTR
jgi:hypothetical protein